MYKGFDKNMKCRGFEYEIGKEYEEEKAELCCAGFHACENPIDVFGYYSPADSRYCEVSLEEVSDEHGDDSKRCGRRIKIGAEIGIKDIIDAFVKFTFDHIDWKNSKEANTGNHSAATNTGYHSAATNTGNHSAATVTGGDSVAIATGINGKAKGAKDCYIVLAEWEQDTEYNWHIKTVKSHKVDGKMIKPDTFYMLSGGKFKEVK